MFHLYEVQLVRKSEEKEDLNVAEEIISAARTLRRVASTAYTNSGIQITRFDCKSFRK